MAIYLLISALCSIFITTAVFIDDGVTEQIDCNEWSVTLSCYVLALIPVVRLVFAFISILILLSVYNKTK